MSFFRSPTLRRIIYGIFLILAAGKLVALSHAEPSQAQAPPAVESSVRRH